MAQTSNTRSVYPSDFKKPGLHIDPHRAHRLLFEFLRLSPSYELARKARQEGLSQEEADALPADFDQVLNTYDLLGDVQKILFGNWWRQRGLKAYGNPYSQPEVHKIKYLPGGADLGLGDCAREVDRYLTETRPIEGLSPGLLLSIPLDRPKAEILRQVSKLLDYHKANDTNAMAKPPLALASKRIHIKKLVVSLKLLTYKAARPNWELWRLGAFAEVSETYSPIFDPMGPRKVSDPQQSVDRLLMTKTTSRALKKAELIAENAARGKFPSDDPVEMTHFDFHEIAARNSKKNTWERAEIKRLDELKQARIAAVAAIPKGQ